MYEISTLGVLNQGGNLFIYPIKIFLQLDN